MLALHVLGYINLSASWHRALLWFSELVDAFDKGNPNDTYFSWKDKKKTPAKIRYRYSHSINNKRMVYETRMHQSVVASRMTSRDSPEHFSRFQLKYPKPRFYSNWLQQQKMCYGVPFTSIANKDDWKVISSPDEQQCSPFYRDRRGKPAPPLLKRHQLCDVYSTAQSQFEVSEVALALN